MFRRSQPQRGGTFVRLASDPELLQEYAAPPVLENRPSIPTAFAVG